MIKSVIFIVFLTVGFAVSKQTRDISKNRVITSTDGTRALYSIGIVNDAVEFFVDLALEPMSWGETLDYCHSFDLNVASIMTLDEQDWTWYSVPSGYSMWLAGSDLFHEGRWEWLRNQEQFVFIRWALGEPLLTNRNNCLYLNEAGNNWVSTQCGTGSYFVLCEDRWELQTTEASLSP